MEDLSAAWRDRDQFDVMMRAPAWVSRRLEGRDGLRHTADSFGAIYDHYGRSWRVKSHGAGEI
jgi:hypothetical protein